MSWHLNKRVSLKKASVKKRNVSFRNHLRKIFASIKFVYVNSFDNSVNAQIVYKAKKTKFLPFLKHLIWIEKKLFKIHEFIYQNEVIFILKSNLNYSLKKMINI